MSNNNLYTLGIDIGSTTVKIAILNEQNEVLFSDYERHFANIQETLSDLLGRANLQNWEPSTYRRSLPVPVD